MRILTASTLSEVYSRACPFPTYALGLEMGPVADGAIVVVSGGEEEYRMVIESIEMQAKMSLMRDGTVS